MYWVRCPPLKVIWTLPSLRSTRALPRSLSFLARVTAAERLVTVVVPDRWWMLNSAGRVFCVSMGSSLWSAPSPRRRSAAVSREL
jgi:hypothetical protein